MRGMRLRLRQVTTQRRRRAPAGSRRPAPGGRWPGAHAALPAATGRACGCVRRRPPRPPIARSGSGTRRPASAAGGRCRRSRCLRVEQVARRLSTSASAPPCAGTVSLRVCSSTLNSLAGDRGPGSRPARGDRPRSWRTTTSMRSPPTWALSSSAVPRAMIRPWSTTAIVSASSSASSRYWVVSSSVVPSRDQAPDDVPHAQPAAGVEAGRRLVEEQQPRPPDERAGEVEPAAHAAGVGLDDPVAGVDQVELLEQLAGARFASALGSW